MKKRHLLAFHTCLVSLSQSVQSEPLFFFLGSSFSEWWQLRARPCAKRFDPCYEMIHRVIRLSGVIRQTINAPHFEHSKAWSGRHVFAPEKGKATPLLSHSPSVRRILRQCQRCHLCCFIMPCYAQLGLLLPTTLSQSGTAWIALRFPECHSSRSYMLCKVQGGSETLLKVWLMELLPDFLVFILMNSVVPRSCCLTGKKRGIVDTGVW